MSPKNEVRPIMWEWVRYLYLESKERNIEFEEIQHELEEMYS